MENNQQQFSPGTYTGIIQELNNTIANLNLELALTKTQYKETLQFAQELQIEINKIKETEEVNKAQEVE